MTDAFERALARAGIDYGADVAVREAFATDSSGRRGAVPSGIARPRGSAQLERLVRTANEAGVRLVPVSSPAGPRRYGDTIADTPAVIVDLSGMNRVLHVSQPEGIAIVEPGVTFPAFAAALARHGLRPYQPLLPRAGKSVLTAFLEREPMTVPGKHWDSSDPLAAMELVFGNGDLFRTGGDYMPGTLEENLAIGNRQMSGIGPGHNDFGRVVQGAQGALGIVAWASIYCQRIPAAELPLLAGSDSLAPLVALAYRQLRRRGEGQLFLMNNVQLALLLADGAADFMRLKAALPRWTLYLEVTAPSAFPDEAIAYRRALIEADADALALALAPDIVGVPAAAISSAQRSYAATPPAAQFGLFESNLFFLTQLNRAGPLIDALVTEGGGDCAIYLQPKVHGVNAHCALTWLGMDPAGLQRTARAAAERAAALGGFLSRPAYPWADVAFARDPSIMSLLKRTKGLLDPADILQPGGQALGAATSTGVRS